MTFLFQFGNLRDMVTVPAAALNLKLLKDMACDFINSKVSLKREEIHRDSRCINVFFFTHSKNIHSGTREWT